MRVALERVAREYIQAKSEALAGHPLAEFMKNELPQSAGRLAGAAGQGFHIKSTNFPGTWPLVPWLGFFHPAVGESAQRGFYVVFLFDEACESIYLSLNQGATELQNQYGLRESDAILDLRARLMRASLPDFLDDFPLTEIRLGGGRLARGYEKGHALGKAYRLDALPTNEELGRDLVAMLQAYRALIFRGAANEDVDDVQEGEVGQTVEERRRYRLHQRIERNPTAARRAKRRHGYVCQACDFDFLETYGEIGREYIEAHHLVPLHELAHGAIRRYDVAVDFAVLCSNCHRMIHRRDPADLAGLRAQVRRRD